MPAMQPAGKRALAANRNGEVAAEEHRLIGLVGVVERVAKGGEEAERLRRVYRAKVRRTEE